MFVLSSDTTLPQVIPQAIADGLGEGAIRTLLGDIMEGAREYWIALAWENLNSSRNMYIRGISPVNIEGTTASITLRGSIANMVEKGAPPVDLRTLYLVTGSKVAYNEDGSATLYRYVPFTHKSDTATSDQGQPMGNPYKKTVDNAAEIGRDVYQHAKSLSPTTSTPGGGNNWGERMGSGYAPKLKQAHQSDIYQGMYRQEKTYKDATQTSQYMTFRTISTKNPEGWMRPAIKPRNLSQKVQNYIVRDLGPAAFEAYTKGLIP
jgi:hypothetical protein